MAEILDGGKTKVIAYYLPQFHSIPENDKAWGEGFTEWTNIRKTEPMFKGHNQPKVPLNNNYYNLLNDDVKIWQSKLAKKNGVFGFCYYHYWFKDGKQLLEKPMEQMLDNKNIDIPFCISWANENWTKNWDGGKKELIAEQDYGNEKDWKMHLEYLVKFFKDERYITLNKRPIFLIYKPEEIPNIDKMIDFWNKEIIKHGFNGICYMIQNPNWYFSPSYNMGRFDYQIKFYPFWSLALKGKNMSKFQKIQTTYQVLKELHLNWIVDKILPTVKKMRHKKQIDVQTKLDYDEVWNILLESPTTERLIEGAFVDWDNSPRKRNGYVHIGATPEKFGEYMLKLFKKINTTKQQPVVFLNAWNEWCEGAYLEPDEFNEHKYLEKLKEAINNNVN